MNKITIVGLDLAKNTLHVVGCNAAGTLLKKKQLHRSGVLTFFANLPPCLVGMESCSSAHYWARELQAVGHEVRLIAPQHVKPYVRGNKNDYNDALAITEAVVRPQMRFCSIKTPEQQDLQSVNVQRQQFIAARTQQANRLRALLAERGVWFPKGIGQIRREVPELLGTNTPGLSETTLTMLSLAYVHFQQLDAHIDTCDTQLHTLNQRSDHCQRLQSIPGFGPIVASMFYAQVGNGKDYQRGRDVSAAVGIVPRQHSSGGKPTLLGISKRGNKPLRTLLIHGARAVVSRAQNKHDKLSRWIQALIDRVGIHKATVAYANKMARMGWALLYYQETYTPGNVHLIANR